MATVKSAPLDSNAESESIGDSPFDLEMEKTKGSRRVRLTADKMTLTVNELTIAAGVIHVVRNPPLPPRSEAEIVFDELNADEYTMRYAD